MPSAARRRFIAMAAVALSVAVGAPVANARRAQRVRITGAGASFPFPLYSAWFQEFSRINSNVRVDFQSTGSGAGVQALINRTVDFAASDSAMTDKQIAQVKGGVVLLPMTAGTIVLSYNLQGVTTLKLPRVVYPLIFTGEVSRWRDERIVAANPGVALPDLPITVVRRSDSSGTTFVFTKHLSAINTSFKKAMGVGTTVQWPSRANFVGAPRNDGVAATIRQTPGAIGYIEFGFAKLSNQPMALLENSSGRFIMPSGESGAAALASADLTGRDLRIWVEDPSGADAYPITTFTWMLFYRKHGNAQIAGALRNMVEWAITDGQKMASELGYVPLPDVVVKRVRAEVVKIQ
jgi:phosphate transport system substrate-binding protein